MSAEARKAAQWQAKFELRQVQKRKLEIIETIARGHDNPRALATGYLRDLAKAEEAVAKFGRR